MNTKISYMYRDADNYKTFRDEVLSGEITQKQKDEITECLHDEEFFIPHQVGLPEVRFEQVTESDHAWFEFHPEEDVTLTNQDPTIDMTVDELVEKFQAAKGNWDEETFSDYASAMLGTTEPNREIRVKVKGGYLVATPSYDPDYTGIDVEFQPDNEEIYTFPRVLMECPKDGELRALIWDDPQSEDYTKEIKFN